MLAKQDNYFAEAAATVYEIDADERIREQCRAREDYYKQKRVDARAVRNLKKELAAKDEVIAAKDGVIAEKDNVIAAKDDELAQSKRDIAAKDGVIAAQSDELAAAYARIAALEAAGKK